MDIENVNNDFMKVSNETLDSCAAFLEDFFWAQLITMSVDVEDGHLLAKDDEGNKWKDAEIYDFALNECLCFNPDGSLASGLGAAEPFVERLKEDAKLFGVSITSFVKVLGLSNNKEVVDMNRNLSENAQKLYDVFAKELLAYGKPDDGFIPSNSSLIAGFDYDAINELLDTGIIQVRNCVGHAYEFTRSEREKVLSNQSKTVDAVLSDALERSAKKNTGITEEREVGLD